MARVFLEGICKARRMLKGHNKDTLSVPGVIEHWLVKVLFEFGPEILLLIESCSALR